jgi:hypothetical protein
MCDHLKTEKRTAKKRYICVWCNENIEPGEKYTRDTGVYDGVFQSNPWHPECYGEAQDQLEPCELFTPGEAERPARKA